MINVSDGEFYAPANVPYAEELRKAMWRQRKDGSFYTDDLMRVLPVVQYLDPSLATTLFAGAEDHKRSTAKEASPDFKIPIPDGLKLYGFQEADVEFICNHDNTLLAEDAGLGKSAIMVAAANVLRPKRVLIICPAIAKYNWYLKEWPKWTTLNLSVGVAESNSYPNTDVVIINYDILAHHHKALHALPWDIMFVDESHRIKNADAKRTRYVFGGAVRVKKKDRDTFYSLRSLSATTLELPPIPADRAVFASATPMNRPIDLWTMIRRCDPDGLGRDRRAYEDRYCEAYQDVRGRNTKGAAHLEELGARMRSTFMLRHDPKEVLDLPPLREDLFLLPPVKIIIDGEEDFVRDNIDALLGLAKATGVSLSKNSPPEAFLRLIGEAVIDNVSAIGDPQFEVLFTKFALIRKETGIAKVPHVIDFINDKSNDGEEPIVVFGYHKDVMTKLREAYPDAAYVIGGMSSKMRNEMVDRFQNGQTNHFLLNIDAGGEAITATRANKLVFAEMDWRGTAMIQARKRIHRISQVHACNVWYLAAAKSMDSLVADKAFSKMENIKRTLDL